MNPEKAIKILSDSAYAGMTTFNKDFKDSQKLLIEAGKRTLTQHKYSTLNPNILLPGETKD